jgi:hypothetical protein
MRGGDVRAMNGGGGLARVDLGLLGLARVFQAAVIESRRLASDL